MVRVDNRVKQEENLTHRTQTQDVDVDVIKEHSISEDQQDYVVEQEDVAQHEDGEGGFPKGLKHTSLLIHYTQHIAFSLQQDRVSTKPKF